ncbi:MAG: hypothetical protein F7C82_04670 [Desulfurococcales archaeon]|nr:hypothetical protein [Desulfurococcales archaeon]
MVVDSELELIDECADEYMRQYARTRIHRIDVELHDVMSGKPPSEIEVYLKSVREVSIDEIPIVKSILNAFEGRRLIIYEYENIRKRDDRARLASRLVERGIEEGRSFILVLPSLMPLSLATSLPYEIQEAVADSLALTITITYDNLLYLPEGQRRGIEIVAKENSEASYERVKWLKEKAEELGVYVKKVVYLADNKEIFEYVTELGADGIYERVPVNKLASYIVSLARCLRIPGIREFLHREQVKHYIYGYKVPYQDFAKLSNILVSYSGSFPVPGGLLYNVVYRGVRTLLAELMNRLGLL